LTTLLQRSPFFPCLEQQHALLFPATVELIARRTSTSTFSRSVKAKQQGRIVTTEVEKVYPGFATVLVDDKFRARLEPSTYNGPRELIKKGKKFKARATITKLSGKTAILIHDVVEVI
jgi:hypothetical protein